MERRVLSILSALFIVFLVPVYGAIDKIYVEPRSVQYERNCLLVEIEGQISQVKAIRCDEGGLFVTAGDLVDQREAYWYCEKGHRVENQYDKCPVCGSKK